MTVASRREREQLMRRETILNSARKLFKEKGFDSTTVDEIAFHSELGKGTIYSYFKSKDEIFIAILENEFEILKERMLVAINESTTAISALDKLFNTFIQYNRERRGIIDALFIQVDQQNSSRVNELLRGLKSKVAEWTQLVGKVLHKGIEQGEFQKIDIEKTAQIIIGLILGLIIESEMGQIQEDLSIYRETIFGVLLKGIIKNN